MVASSGVWCHTAPLFGTRFLRLVMLPHPLCITWMLGPDQSIKIVDMKYMHFQETYNCQGKRTTGGVSFIDTASQ